MKDEATPEQIAMARRIAAAELRNRNDWADLYRDAILSGGHDGSEGVRCALAAIIETTEMAAAYVQNWDSDCDELAYDLRSGDHLKGQNHG